MLTPSRPFFLTCVHETKMGSLLKTALAQRKFIRLFGLGQLCHPKLIELVGWQGGFDAVWFDQEHAGLNIAQIEEASRAARAVGLDSFVRLAATDYATVMRPLEAGAGGVMAAMIRTVEQAVDLIRWAKFHPRGERGLNGSGVDARYGLLVGPDYLRQGNNETVVIVQVEHRDAVQVCNQLADLPDVDFLFIGPADLSQSLGIPCQWNHPDLWAAIETVAKACAARNKPWAILPPGNAAARRCVDLGCRIFSLGLDTWVFQKGVQAVKEEYASLFTAGEP